MSGFIERLENDVADFEPKPGGIVDTWRKNEERKAVAAEEAENTAEKVEESSYKAVKVTELSPEIVSAITYNIPAGQYAMVLPASPYRYRATIQVITNASGYGILCKDQSAALSAQGYIIYNNQPTVVHTRAQLWCYNDTTETMQVSVLAEIYAPE
jgi:hypothetical protein